MEQADNLLLRIQKYDKTFSKGQKRLAAYVLKNYDKAVFLTASKLGKEVGVSESTTVRFATQLGYKGFPEFHRALEELVRNKLNSIQRMKVTYGLAGFLESFCHDGVQHNIWCCHGILRSYHTELKFVSGKGKR